MSIKPVFEGSWQDLLKTPDVLDVEKPVTREQARITEIAHQDDTVLQVAYAYLSKSEFMVVNEVDWGNCFGLFPVLSLEEHLHHCYSDRDYDLFDDARPAATIKTITVYRALDQDVAIKKTLEKFLPTVLHNIVLSYTTAPNRRLMSAEALKAFGFFRD